MFYKIEETVGGGLYFTWDNFYSTRASAIGALEKEIAAGKVSPSKVRVWPYSTGRWNGAIRLAADLEE